MVDAGGEGGTEGATPSDATRGSGAGAASTLASFWDPNLQRGVGGGSHPERRARGVSLGPLTPKNYRNRVMAPPQGPG